MSEQEIQYEVLLHDFINIIEKFKRLRDSAKKEGKKYVVMDLMKLSDDINNLIGFNNNIYDLVQFYKETITALSATNRVLSIDNSNMFEDLVKNGIESGNELKDIPQAIKHINTTILALKYHGKKAN